jgi:hypothetical protein
MCISSAKAVRQIYHELEMTGYATPATPDAEIPVGGCAIWEKWRDNDE